MSNTEDQSAQVQTESQTPAQAQAAEPVPELVKAEEEESKPKVVCLKADPPVFGQEWCVLTFISPEDHIRNKALLDTDQFMSDVVNEYIAGSGVHMAKSINAQLEKKFEAQILRLKNSKAEHAKLLAQQLTEIRRDLQFNEEDIQRECVHKHSMEIEDLIAKFEDYRIQQAVRLEKAFRDKFGPATNVRGLKFCGAFPTPELASERAEFLASHEPHVHHFVSNSFQWLPFDPNPDAIKDNRYQDKELDELMRRKMENERMKDKFFENRKNQMIKESGARTKKDLKKQLKKKYKGRFAKN